MIHLHDAFGIRITPFMTAPVVYTMHHPHEPNLSHLYSRFPDVTDVAISEFQRRQEDLPRTRTVHHGIPLNDYTFRTNRPT